jgi:hypothetical protein
VENPIKFRAIETVHILRGSIVDGPVPLSQYVVVFTDEVDFENEIQADGGCDLLRRHLAGWGSKNRQNRAQ